MTAFCILAAGIGKRLHDVSNLHKALLPLQDKAVLSHIIDKAPDDAEIIIAVGHQKELIQQYCQAAHPNKKFTFVFVDNYDQPGCGPGYSLLCCKPHLNQPFYIFCADCVVIEEIPDLTCNWIGVYPVTDPENWATAQIRNNKVVAFKNKTADGYTDAFIGAAGIKDHKIFWEQLQQGRDKEFELVSAFYHPDIFPMQAVYFTWHDTGTLQTYSKTKDAVGHHSLGMPKELDEATYKCGNRCIKLFLDDKIANKRIIRSKNLSNIIPTMVYTGNNVYAYEWVDGQTFYQCASSEQLARLLAMCEKKLWHEVSYHKNFRILCHEFYYKKTMARIQSYLKKKNLSDDHACIINGHVCKSVFDHLTDMPWHELIDGKAVLFHGDLQPENIIFGNEIKLIDWRDSFADDTNCGDIYYDFAKLMAGLCMSYENIKNDLFTVSKDGYSFQQNNKLNEIREFFENWLLKKNYNLRKIRILTAIVYLNMSPLHVAPFDELLFKHAKYLLSTL